jgi:hypothetical protein
MFIIPGLIQHICLPHLIESEISLTLLAFVNKLQFPQWKRRVLTGQKSALGQVPYILTFRKTLVNNIILHREGI